MGELFFTAVLFLAFGYLIYQKLNRKAGRGDHDYAEAGQTLQPPDPPVEEGICHGLLCASMEDSNGDEYTYAMVMLKDYSKLGSVVNALFEVKSPEEFKAVAKNDEFMTLGYFLIREDLSRGVKIEDEYYPTINNEQYSCKRIYDTRIDTIPLPDKFFAQE